MAPTITTIYGQQNIICEVLRITILFAKPEVTHLSSSSPNKIMGTSITMNRLRLFRQKIEILNTNSLNSNTITLLPSSFNKNISFTTNTNNNDDLFDHALAICNANPLHFITLSFLFLPFTIVTTAAIQLLLSSADVTTFKTLTSFGAAIFFVIFSTISGVALIIYSTYHTICRTPLSFTSIFKSLSHSFIPLLSTFMAATLKLAFISLFIILLGLRFQLDKFEISRVLGITILFYVLGWGLAPVIAVLESKSGFVSLRESVKIQPAYYRLKFFNMVFGRGIVIWLVKLYSSNFLNNTELVSNWLAFLLVSGIHLHSSVIIVNYVVSTTLLYVRTKAARSGYVVVKTTMHVPREDTRALMLGWFSNMIAIFYLIVMMSYLMF